MARLLSGNALFEATVKSSSSPAQQLPAAPQATPSAAVGVPVPAPVPAVAAVAALGPGSKPPYSEEATAELATVPGLQQLGDDGEGAAQRQEPLNPLLLPQTLPNPTAAADEGGRVEATWGMNADSFGRLRQKAYSMEGTSLIEDTEGATTSAMNRKSSRNWTMIRGKVARGELKADLVKHPVRIVASASALEPLACMPQRPLHLPFVALSLCREDMCCG